MSREKTLNLSDIGMNFVTKLEMKYHEDTTRGVKMSAERLKREESL